MGDGVLHAPNHHNIVPIMSRVVSIEQSEPGLYIVNVLRSEAQSLGKILESIAHPPVEDEANPTTARDVDDMLSGRPASAPRGGSRRRPARGH